MSPEVIMAQANRPKVLLISGYKRSGKDWIAQKLVSMVPKSKIYSFASPMKAIIANTFDISLTTLDTYKNTSKSLYLGDELTLLTDFRKILQRFGNEAMKPIFGDAVWANLFLSQYNPRYTYILPDWRFNIEYQVLSKKCNVVTIRIVDTSITNNDLHPSETELDSFKFDYYIDNTDKTGVIPQEVYTIATNIQKGN